MSDELFRILVPVVIALLIIWLIYRIKMRIGATIRNEIYNNFPTIKNTIDNFQIRMDHLKTQIEILEGKIKDLENRAIR
jgi:hypothetical protein